MLLSICIPTFNRCVSLNKLLFDISNIDKELKSKIQVCISNNFSDDDTEDVIESYKKKIHIKAKNQANNIGAYKNLLYVLNMAEGIWSLAIGDDDSLGEEFNELIRLIDNANNDLVIINGTFEMHNQKKIFIDFFRSGPLTKINIQKKLLTNGLYPFGYIGNYTFPSIYFKNLKIIPKNWIQIYLLLKCLYKPDQKFYFLNKKIINFKNDGKLYWSAINRCKINLLKLNMLIDLFDKKIKFSNKIFTFLLYLREILDINNFKNFLICKYFSKKKDFKNLISSINKLNNFFLLNAFYRYLLMLTLFIPDKFIKKMIDLKNPNYINNYLKLIDSEKNKDNEGYRRKI